MEQNPEKKLLNATFISGLVTGAINKFLTHPVDTLKAKMQVKKIILKNPKNQNYIP
jgi:hypothetical protein